MSLAALVLTVFVFFAYGLVPALCVAVAQATAIVHLSMPQHLLGSNVLGTLSSSLILQEVLAIATKVHPVLTAVTMDFGADAIKKDQTILARIVGKPTVNNFGTAATETADTDVSVTLSLFKEVRYKFTAAEIAATDRNFIRERAKPMAMAVGDYLASLAATSLSTVANHATEVIEALADTDYETLTAGREKLTDTKQAPRDNRYCAVNPATFTKLLNDARCNRQYKDTGPDPIMDGTLPKIAGFERVDEWHSWPTTDNGAGAFWHKSSVALVVRPPVNPAEVFDIPFPGNIGTVTNPDPTAPFTVLAFESINGSDLSVETVIVFLAGIAKGNDMCVRLVTA